MCDEVRFQVSDVVGQIADVVYFALQVEFQPED